jgi:hypothetical protein
MKITKIVVLMLLVVSVTEAQAQQKHAALSEQKMCADQAKKFYNGTSYSDNNKKAVKNEFTSHYDAPEKVCYVRINYNLLNGQQLSVGSYIFDAFEGRNLASYIWISEPKKKYWEVKPVLCWVKPIGDKKADCESSAEFETLVDKHFGLGEEE